MNKLKQFIVMFAEDDFEAEVALLSIDVDQPITDLDLTPPIGSSVSAKW